MRSISETLGIDRRVLALSIARMADALGNGIIIIIIPLYVARLPHGSFPLPNSVLVGLLISLYGLVNFAFQPLMGALSDRIGRRKPFIEGGLLLMGVGTLSFVLATRFTDLLLIRSLQGIGVAMTVSASMGLMAVLTEKRTRGGAMGIYATFRMFGLTLGPLTGGFLEVHFGFNTAFYAGAVLLFLSLALVQFSITEVPAARSTETARPFRIVDRELLSPGLLSLGFATFVMASAFTMMTTLENQFNARLDQTAWEFSIAFSAMMFSRLLLQVPLGKLSDRIGRKPLILAGLLLMAPVTALLGEAASTLQLAELRVLQGVASAGIAAPAFALAADLASSGGESRQMSIITMGFGLGIALGPLLAGILVMVFFEFPFLVGGFLSLLGAGVVYRYAPETVQRKERKSRPPPGGPAAGPPRGRQ